MPTSLPVLLRVAVLFLFVVVRSQDGFAQSKATPKKYMYLIYHKLSPGLTIQDALPVEREWRKINQAAVDEGKLESWAMTVKQFTSNPDQTEYDYVTRIITPTFSMKGASPEAMRRLYGDSIQTKMADLQKRDRMTAPVVKIEIWEITDGTFAPTYAIDGTQTMVIERMRRRNPGAEYDNVIKQAKQLSTERIKRNALLGWDFSTLLVPNGSEKGYEFSTAQYVSSLSAMADPGLADTPTPIMAAPVYKQLRNQTAQVFDVVRQEVYRFQEFTTKSGN